MYYGEHVFIWLILSLDILTALVAWFKKLADVVLLSFFELVLCFRLYDPYLFYGSVFDPRRYVNLKEAERTIVNLCVIVFTAVKVSREINE